MATLQRAFLYALIGIVGLWAVTARGLPPPEKPTNASNNEDDVVRCISLPRTKTGNPLDLYIARTKAKLPSAILILCPDRGQDIKAFLSSPAWQNFAEDHSLGLAAVTVTFGQSLAAKNAQPPSDQNQESLVLKAVDREFGSGIPLLLYGWPQQTGFAKSLLAADPKRVLGWCLRTPAHVPDLDSATAPGIVICYKENKPLYDALMQDFVRARKKGARLTWIALAGAKPAGSNLPALDIFVRDYFAAALAAKHGLEQWEDVNTKQAVSAMDLNTHPELSSYLPHVALASAWANLHVPGGPELAQQAILEREEDTYNKAQPKLHLYLRKPLSAEKTGGKIGGMLAFCTWKKEKTSLVGRLQDRNDFLVRYAEEHRLALLTWDTAQAWSKKESADQRSQQENFKDDLGFDKLANAWERGVHVLCYEAGLPETDFLLYGISRGAQWAHRLALRKPEHFLAIHIHVNSSYDWPTPAAKNILWLQTTGDREAGYEAAKRFYARCRDMGYPIIFKAGENLGHSDSKQIDTLGLRFFDYALSVKAKRDVAAANTKTLRAKYAPPSSYTLNGLDDAPYYADFINQEVYKADEKEMVPAGQRVPLPTKALAQAWSGNAVTPALISVSSPATISEQPSGARPLPGPSAQEQVNYFGSTMPPEQSLPANASASTTVAPAGNAFKQQSRGDTHEPSPNAETAPTSPGQSYAERYQLAVKRAVTEYPALAQAGSALNAAFLSQHQRLKDSNDALLANPSWPEQVARLVQEQMAPHSDFAEEFKASVERAVLLYPALAQADSPMNTTFLAEYQRLKAAGDALLTNPTWPEQVARTASAKLTNQSSR